MSIVPKIILGIFTLLFVIAFAVVYLLYLEPRPKDTTERHVYQDDAHTVDYCDKAQLDGSYLTADEIPKAYTLRCGMKRWPAPILAGCTEPLPPEAADLRGLWQAVDGQVGHVERIEQCGNRVVVSGRSFIHDFRTTGTLSEGANDINPRHCIRIRAAVRWGDNKKLVFRPWRVADMVSRRLEDENTLIWEYGSAPTSRLKRICKLPPKESSKS
ncbi:MAG: hypothetical protein AAF512_22985 [Pseudomonadota bacterium]